MKQPNYLVFGLIWTMAALVSIANYVQSFPVRTPGNLVRAGLFLLLGLFYFWLNRRRKGR